jgi:FkbM family methyltransferase
MTNNIIVNKNNLSFTVEDSQELHQDKGYNFWKEKYSSWENETFNFLDKFLSKEKDYLDIGSWVGPTVIYSSFLCRSAVAVEPDPVAYKILNTNISLNHISNIKTINKAVSIFENSFMSQSKFFGDSMTKVSSNPKNGTPIEAIGLDSLFDMGDFSIIKMDVEGSEFDIVPYYATLLKQKKIPLYLSMHGPFFNDGAKKTNTLINSLSDVDKVYNEAGDLISIKDISNSFGSYLFVW